MHTYSFEKLEAWKRSWALTKEIYILTEKFPESERFGLTGQIRRSIISVCSSLSEGSSRSSKKDQAHFYNISCSSMMELLNQLIISSDLRYIEETTLAEIRGNISHITLLISRLTSSILNK